jgi:hypothetical protein
VCFTPFLADLVRPLLTGTKVYSIPDSAIQKGLATLKLQFLEKIYVQKTKESILDDVSVCV